MQKDRVGANLKRLRNWLGLTQSDVAGRMDMQANAYGHWEAGRVELRASDLVRLSLALHIPLGTLMRALDFPIEEHVLSVGQWIDNADENIRQNMQGAGGETPTPDAVLAAEAARKRGRMPYSDAGSASYAYSHG